MGDIPQEWVEKGAAQLAPPNSAGQRQYRKQDRDNARAMIEALLPDILEAVAREIEQYPFGRDASTEFIKETTAQIVRNFGEK